MSFVNKNIGLHNLPDSNEFPKIIDSKESDIRVMKYLLDDKHFTSYDDVSSLSVHTNTVLVMLEALKVHLVEPQRTYIYYFNNWTVIASTEIVKDTEYKAGTFVTLINKIPWNKLPRQQPYTLPKPFNPSPASSHNYSLPTSSSGRHSGADTQQGYVPKLKKLPVVTDWLVFGLFDGYADPPPDTPRDDQLEIIVFRNPSEEEKMKLDLARRNFTARVVQKYLSLIHI